jgi:hypothetical protein
MSAPLGLKFIIQLWDREYFPTPTESDFGSFGSHPCLVVPGSYELIRLFHGGTGFKFRRGRSPNQAAIRLLLGRIVVQIWSQPSFDFARIHSFAFGIVGDLVTIDLAQAEITRFRMGEV